MSVSDVIESYLRSLERDSKSAHTIDATRYDLQQLGAFLGRQSLSSVGTADLASFVQWLLRQQGNRVSSVRRKTSSVKGLFRYLAARGRIASDPSLRVVYPALEVRELTPLADEETARLIDSARLPLWRGLTLCFLDAGLKRDEAVALRWGDLVLGIGDGEPRMHVRHRRYSQRARLRTLSLTPRLRDALAALQPPVEDAVVFGLSVRGADFVVETAAARAGVRPGEKVTPRMLRDAFACRRVSDRLALEAEIDDPAKSRDLVRAHDLTLLRELGLSERSTAASRYRLMVGRLQGDRTE